MPHPIWTLLHPRANAEHLGFLPSMLSTDDPRPAREQFNDHYRHGGGWDPFPGFTLNPDKTLSYPGDSLTLPLAETRLRDEVIRLYTHSWVLIQQPDGSYEICRMD